MPHIESLEPKKHALRILFGQIPLTRFKDYRNAVKVDLIKYDDRDKMLRGTYDFVKATWSEDGRESERATEEEMKDALQHMLAGKTLSLGLETVNLMFRISGISRVDTHQIARQRIGVTFSQQCTGDRFLTHNDVLVEECINTSQLLLNEFIKATLACKKAYSVLTDKGISIQVAREIMPHNLETFIFMKIDLSTLLFFFQKRIEDGSQTWQMNEVSRQMASEVSKVYPELAPVFEKYSRKFTLQRDQSADRKNTYSSGLYVPKYDEFDYHTRDFLYPIKKEDAVYTNTPISDMYYWGDNAVTKDEFYAISKAYDELNAEVANSHWSNEEIIRRANSLNSELMKKYGPRL